MNQLILRCFTFLGVEDAEDIIVIGVRYQCDEYDRHSHQGCKASSVDHIHHDSVVNSVAFYP